MMSIMRSVLVFTVVTVVTVVTVAGCCLAGCGGGAPARSTRRVSIAQRPPLAPCSLLTAREVSAALGVRVRVARSRAVCTYQGTRADVFHSLLVTPQTVEATPPVAFTDRNGSVQELAGRGFRGQAQEDPPSHSEAGLDQASAQVISGGVIVRLLATYHGPGLSGVQQVREVIALAERVGRRLARMR